MTEPLPPYFDELSERSIFIPEALEEPAHTQQFLIKHRNNRITEFFIPTHELLVRIEAADPDAMRAYLRETAPEVIADLYRPEVPEADSPDDVDEHPEPVTFEWEDPPALNTPGSRPAQYWNGITIMLRSRRGAWAKVGENVNPDAYRRQLRARGCEVTTRNRRNGNRCDVYARFPRSGGAR